ncbi:MAG: protein kinase [Planctomycetes bacterium]|nr:protein kinase [Planctomycetota bacterium]
MVPRAALEQFVHQRDAFQRQGRACTLGQLLMEQRHLSPQHYTEVHQEVERRLAGNSGSGRMTPSTGHFRGTGPVDDTGRFRMATPGTGRYAMVPGGLQQVGGSGSGRFPGGAPPGSGRFVTPGSGRLEGSLTRSWKAQRTTPGEQGPGASTGGDFGVGRFFGPYQILDELGRGGMGVVYRVQREGIARQMALKVLIAGEFASPKLLRRFREEAKVATDLKHPNIVAVHDVGEVDGVPYYAMDYVEGSELQELIRNRNLSVRRGVEILIDVAHAAHHAHEKGIVHRDLKPSNVLVSGDGTPYIMDFGLAKNLQQDHGLTRSGVAIGTPYYMPPEQAKGQHREMGAWSDVYAMGAILYEILTRRVPFTAKTQNELLRKIVEEDPTPPRQIRSGIPVPLERIALKALRKEKERRYQTAQAFAEDLERYLTGEAVHARADPPWYHAMRWLRRNKGMAVAGVITVCALTVAGFAIAFRDGRPAETVGPTDPVATELTPEQQKQLEEQFARGFDHLGRYYRTHDPSTARDALNRAELEFGQAVKLEEGLLGEAQPRTAYYRGVVRRGLCRWADSQNDFLLAARSSDYQARAQLARGLILLRWHLNPEGARAALRQAVVGEVKDEEEARIERAANVIATAYLAFLDDEYPRARSLLAGILDRRGLGRLEAEARGAQAYMARERGRMFGGDDEAEFGLRPSARALELEPFRYEFLIDRSMLLARKGAGDRAEARSRLQEARVVCPAGEGAELAEALIVALEGNEPGMLRSLRAAEEKVRGRRSTVADRVRRFGQRLRQAYAETQPTVTQPDPLGPQQPPQPQDPEQFVQRGPRVNETMVARWELLPGKQALLFAIDVTDDVLSVEIMVADNPVPLQICGNLNRPVSNPDQADWGYKTAEGEPPTRLIVRRQGTPRLGSGTYNCLLLQDRPRNLGVPVRIEIILTKDPADVPPEWEKLASLDMSGGTATDRRNLQDIARRFSTAPSEAARRRALEDWKEFESPDFPDRALMRANWQADLEPEEALKIVSDPIYANDRRAQFVKGRILGELKRYDEAIACLDQMAKQYPEILDPKVQVLNYYAATKREGTVERIEELLARDPRNPLLRLIRFQILAECDPDKFREAWAEIEALEVPYVSAVLQLLPLWGEVDPEQGLEIAERWIKRQPEVPSFVSAKGVLLAFAGRVEEGLGVLRSLRSQLNPLGQQEVERLIRKIQSPDFNKPDDTPK